MARALCTAIDTEWGEVFCALQSVVQWCNTGIYCEMARVLNPLSLPRDSISQILFSSSSSSSSFIIINASFLPFSRIQNSPSIKFIPIISSPVFFEDI